MKILLLLLNYAQGIRSFFCRHDFENWKTDEQFRQTRPFVRAQYTVAGHTVTCLMREYPQHRVCKKCGFVQFSVCKDTKSIPDTFCHSCPNFCVSHTDEGKPSFTCEALGRKTEPRSTCTLHPNAL